MRAADIALIVICLGLLLFAVSWVFPQWSGSPKQQWSADDAAEYQELSREMHRLDYQFAAQRKKDPQARPSDEFARTTDSYQQKEQQLLDAQQAGQGMAIILRYLGMGLVCIGGFCYLASRSGDD
jgi:hypothetical protein